MSLLDFMKILTDPDAQADLGHTVEYYTAAFDLLLEREGITEAEIEERIETRKAVKSGEEN